MSASPFIMLAPDLRELNAALVLQLTDGVTGTSRLAGGVDVTIGLLRASFQKELEATFVFVDLPAGAYNVSVASAQGAPYYLPKLIPVTLPFTDKRWPAYPDKSLANLNKTLDDPTQPAAYRAQRDLARLMPSTAYPFSAGSTLLRGVITAGVVPLPGAFVRRSGQTNGYTTGVGGEYVLFFDGIVGRTETVTIVSSHPARPDVSAPVNLLRGTTATLDLVMTP